VGAGNKAPGRLGASAPSPSHRPPSGRRGDDEAARRTLTGRGPRRSRPGPVVIRHDQTPPIEHAGVATPSHDASAPRGAATRSCFRQGDRSRDSFVLLSLRRRRTSESTRTPMASRFPVVPWPSPAHLAENRRRAGAEAAKSAPAKVSRPDARQGLLFRGAPGWRFWARQHHARSRRSVDGVARGGRGARGDERRLQDADLSCRRPALREPCSPGARWTAR